MALPLLYEIANFSILDPYPAAPSGLIRMWSISKLRTRLDTITFLMEYAKDWSVS